MGDFNPDNYKDDFVADLVAFVAADDFQSLFEQFFLKYSVEFDFDEEQKLRYYEIYQDFHDLFESRLEKFCRSKDIPQGEFLTRCRDATCEDEKSRHYMNILLSSVEYETFVKLMYIMKPVAERRNALEAETKAVDDKYIGGAGDKAGAKGGGGGSSSAKGVVNENDDGAKEMQDINNGGAGGADGAAADSKEADDYDNEEAKGGAK